MSDYLTDEEQIARLKSWWEEYGLVLIGAVVVSIVGFVGWRWYDDTRQTDIARASDLYVEFVSSEGTEQEAVAERLSQEFPASGYETLALLAQAHGLVELEDYTGAEVLLKRAQASAERGVLADLVRLRQAKVLQQLDRTEEALEVLKDVRGEGFRPLVAELKGDIHNARGERALAHEAYSAALENLSDGAQRPLLELKVADTADASDS